MNPEQHDAFEPYTSTVLMHYCLMRRPRPDSTDPQLAGQMRGDVFVSVRIVRQVPRDNALLGLAYERLQQSLVALGQTPQANQALRRDIRLLLLALSARRRAEKPQGEPRHG
ncbi:hypothetical protein NUH87_20060 [Pseudomonas batumici]|uniref:hypothetical protein n=1 Tax=Pseudomonas batumici TaxID=226910 RepID=UPI0030D05751